MSPYKSKIVQQNMDHVYAIRTWFANKCRQSSNFDSLILFCVVISNKFVFSVDENVSKNIYRGWGAGTSHEQASIV